MKQTLTALLLLTSYLANAQNFRISIDENGKWGVKGLLAFEYDFIAELPSVDEGRFYAIYKGAGELQDLNGETVNAQGEVDSDGFFFRSETAKMGLIDTFGNILLKPEFDYIFPPSDWSLEGAMLFKTMIATDRNMEVFPERWTGKFGLYDEKGKEILANEYEYLGFIGNLGVASKSKPTKSVNQVIRAGEYNEWGEIQSEFPLGEFNRLHFPSGPFTLFSATAQVMSVENAIYPALQMDEEMMEDRFVGYYQLVEEPAVRSALELLGKKVKEMESLKDLPYQTLDSLIGDFMVKNRVLNANWVKHDLRETNSAELLVIVQQKGKWRLLSQNLEPLNEMSFEQIKAYTSIPNESIHASMFKGIELPNPEIGFIGKKKSKFYLLDSDGKLIQETDKNLASLNTSTFNRSFPVLFELESAEKPAELLKELKSAYSSIIKPHLTGVQQEDWQSAVYYSSWDSIQTLSFQCLEVSETSGFKESKFYPLEFEARVMEEMYMMNEYGEEDVRMISVSAMGFGDLDQRILDGSLDKYPLILKVVNEACSAAKGR